MKKVFRTKGQLLKAIEAGEIPSKLLSPGGVASSLGISREAVYQRIRRGTLDAWAAEGIILVDPRTFLQRVAELGASNDVQGPREARRRG